MFLCPARKIVASLKMAINVKVMWPGVGQSSFTMRSLGCCTSLYTRGSAQSLDLDAAAARCERDKFAVITAHVCNKLEADGNTIPHEFFIHIKDREEILSVRNCWQHDSAAACPYPSVFHHPVESVSIVHPADALEWSEQGTPSAKQLLTMYMKLSKIRLTSLIVVTTMAGYGLAASPFVASTFLLTSVGTGLTSCAANAINQFLEVPYDSQMSRTKARPLVRRQMGELHAVTFAGVTGTLGVLTLLTQVNWVVAALGLGNLLLYTSVYTPLKRFTIGNTWVGAVVGAVPPVMGYAAASGGTLDAPALLLAALLYAWQFPHFNALSWNLKSEYSRAGYRMMSVTAPELCRVTALRYSALITCVVCPLAPLTGLTEWYVSALTLPPNLYLTYLAHAFYTQGDSQSSRRLFRYTLIHLPIIITLLLLGKKRPAQREESRCSIKDSDIS